MFAAVCLGGSSSTAALLATRSTPSALCATGRTARGAALYCCAEDDLTLEDFSEHLAGVRAHYRSTKEMDTETVRVNMLASRIAGLQLRRCHLAPSRTPGAGVGLFASRTICADELITLYPGDALLYWPNCGAIVLNCQ